ncbi:MAG: SpoIID/LytB domain-containing protein [Candidatus Wallbacteria bacterium]|nr:SpoIID/LytB domain-containing protein [Candidatus Wallbacteria bacterium]
MRRTVAVLALSLGCLLAGSALALVRAPLPYFDPARPRAGRGPERVADISFPLVLRIGLMERQDQVAVTCPSAFTIQHGDRLVSAAAGQRWTFRVREAQPAEVEYSAAVKTLDWPDRLEADRDAAAWVARGYRLARVVAAGSLMLNGSAVVHDNRRFFVVVSSSAERAETEAAMKALAAAGERPFLLEKMLKEPQGIIEATGPGGQTAIGRSAFEVVPSGDRVRVFQVEHDIGYPWHGREDRDYAGSVAVMIDRWGKLVAIDRIELEQYLKGVVPCEIEPDAPLEAQKVQAVAARGEALAGYGIRHPADPYDFEASQADQQYAGLGPQTALATQAVLETRGRVLKGGDKIAETVYGANCGGHTEDNESVWTSPVDPHLRAVPDGEPGAVPSPIAEADLASYLESSPEAYCKDPRDVPTNKYRWKVIKTAAELDALALKAGLRVGHVKALVPLERGRSGRLKGLKVVGDQGEAVVLKELPIRQLLGGLRSALFLVKTGAVRDGRPASFTFVGGGWGHGVGMCQMGARGRARAGQNHVAILTHYFAGTEIRQVYK